MNKDSVQQASGPQLQLCVRMAGSRVGSAKLSVPDLAEIMKRMQQLVQRVAQVLCGQQSEGQGRKKKGIKESCELVLAGWREGSAEAVLELAPRRNGQMRFYHIGEESVNALVEGLEAIGRDGSGPLPAGFDTGVLQAWESMGTVLEHGIDEISLTSRKGAAVRSATYSPPLRRRIRNLLAQPTEEGTTTKVGTLEILDGHGHLTGRLWEPDGTRWTCHFKQEHLELLPDAWMHTVRITGKATLGREKQGTIEVGGLLIEDEQPAVPGESEWSAPFWTSLPLESLAEEQGIVAADNLDEISDLWPVDDDPDAMMAHILRDRAERRRKVQEPKG